MPHRMGKITTILLALHGSIAACGAVRNDDPPDGSPADRFRQLYFQALYDQHCLRASRGAEDERLRAGTARLARIKDDALALRFADDVRAAERRWEGFAMRAEFVCESATDALTARLNELAAMLGQR